MDIDTLMKLNVSDTNSVSQKNKKTIDDKVNEIIAMKKKPAKAKVNDEAVLNKILDKLKISLSLNYNSFQFKLSEHFKLDEESSKRIYELLKKKLGDNFEIAMFGNDYIQIGLD